MTRLRVALLDYGAGNLRSAQRGLERAGADVAVADDAAAANSADALVVPGVGNFSSCLANLRGSGLADLVERWVGDDRPVLGICVGMQLLYEHSEEGDVAGLGVLPGRVRRLPPEVVVPHMGWDIVQADWGADGGGAGGGHAAGNGYGNLLAGVAGERCYFVHSYYAEPTDPAHVVATCDYGRRFPCVVRVGRVVGTQFHPEKSADVGARLLRNWVAAAGTDR